MLRVIKNSHIISKHKKSYLYDVIIVFARSIIPGKSDINEK